MLICPKCGRENDSGDNECQNCGIVFDKYHEYIERRTARQEIEKNRAKILRRRILITPLLFILYIPVIALVHTVLGSDRISIVFGLLYMGLVALSVIKWVFSVCPRCDKHFFYDWYSYRKFFKTTD